MNVSELTEKELEAYTLIQENHGKRYKGSDSILIKDVLWDELMDKYYNGKEDETRDLR